MITQLLVFFGACAVTAAALAPPYVQYLTAMYTEAGVVMKEVSPLMESIPLLDSPHRHFAAILHFIDTAARKRSGCVASNYDKEYVKLVNSSALEGLANPQGAIDQLVDLITILRRTIKPVVNLVEGTHPDMEDNKRNYLVHKRIKADLATYKKPAAVFLATGKAATIAEKLNVRISGAAYDLSALKFIINGADVLREVIEATAALRRRLNVFRRC